MPVDRDSYEINLRILQASMENLASVEKGIVRCQIALGKHGLIAKLRRQSQQERLERLLEERERILDGIVIRRGYVVKNAGITMNGSHANNMETIVELCVLSSRTPADLRNDIYNMLSHQKADYWSNGITVEESESGTIRIFPPTEIGQTLSIEAYESEAVASLPDSTRLLRTLHIPESRMELMAFDVGDQVCMGPGLSTSALYPLHMGKTVLYVLDGVERGVPLVGLAGYSSGDGNAGNENEVFVPDRITCRVEGKKEQAAAEEFGGRPDVIYDFIYFLKVVDESAPI